MNSKRESLLAQREIVILERDKFKSDSTYYTCYDSEASKLIDLAGQLQWVVKVHKECKDADLFPNCLDNIVSSKSNYEHGEHGV